MREKILSDIKEIDKYKHSLILEAESTKGQYSIEKLSEFRNAIKKENELFGF